MKNIEAVGMIALGIIQPQSVQTTLKTARTKVNNAHRAP